MAGPRLRALWLVLVALSLPAPGAAQTRIVVTNVLPSPDSLLSDAEDFMIDIDARRIVRRQPSIFDDRLSPEPPLVTTPAGEFMVGAYELKAGRFSQSGIGISRIQSGERWMLHKGTFIAHPVADPVRDAVYFSYGYGDAGRLDVDGLHRWPACVTGVISAIAVARDGSALYLACQTTLLVLDPLSGTEIRRWTLIRPASAMHAVAGQRLFVLDRDPTPGADCCLTLYDSDTGALLKSVAATTSWTGVPTPAGDAILLGRWESATFSSGSAPVLIDSASLTVQVVLPVNNAIAAVFTRDGRRAVLLLEAGQAVRVAIVDMTSNTLMADVQLGFQFAVDRPGLVLIEPPLSPVGIFAEVSGHSVHLVWSLPTHSMAASEYQIEVGVTPASMVPFVIRPASLGTTLQAVDVPSGTYYVRVRGGNAAGVGPASAIAEVMVP